MNSVNIYHQQTESEINILRNLTAIFIYFWCTRRRPQQLGLYTVER